MDTTSMMNFITTHKKKVLFGALVVGAIYMHRRKHIRRCGVHYPRDTVILHTWPRLKDIPNIHTPSMKLETYLRVNNIPYQLDENLEGGPNKDKKDKSLCKPWIEYNDNRVADTKIIIPYLNHVLSADLNEQLTPEEKSTATELQKWLEEHTYWLQYHSRWYIFWDDMIVNKYGCPDWVNDYIRKFGRWYEKSITTETVVGNHSDEEVLTMLVDDIKKFSEVLGDKKFIMGDTITEVDCAAFAVLSQIRWCYAPKCPAHQFLTGGEVQNVVDYMDRIKDTYWPDWDEILAKNGFAKCSS